ncbi:uncharacterized protein TNCV_4786541 [Trichonephila clavipes]|nr:uncharacterized protein TNCV_4786541 [Trichonephila clavipes]
MAIDKEMEYSFCKIQSLELYVARIADIFYFRVKTGAQRGAKELRSRRRCDETPQKNENLTGSENPEFVKCVFEGIVSNRIDEENKQKEQTLREFELQKIRLQNETQRVVGPQTLPQTKIELKKLLPTFNPEVDNMDLFLTLFERQMKLLDLGEDLWVPYLIGALPSDVTSLIAREPEEKCRDYSHIRGMLLQRFKLTAEKFRELFSRHRKSPNGTWKDYYFEI